MLDTQLVGTPVVEVAGDGKTAQGMWVILGAWAKTNDLWGVPVARWGWLKIGADFVKEDGQWKIWHLVKGGLFVTEYNESWVDKSLKLPPRPARWDGHGGGQPDRPSSTQFGPYSITRENKLLPRPPEPYHTFDDVEPYSY
jgi:hypothetical protein